MAVAHYTHLCQTQLTSHLSLHAVAASLPAPFTLSTGDCSDRAFCECVFVALFIAPALEQLLRFSAIFFQPFLFFSLQLFYLFHFHLCHHSLLLPFSFVLLFLSHLVIYFSILLFHVLFIPLQAVVSHTASFALLPLRPLAMPQPRSTNFIAFSLLPLHTVLAIHPCIAI